jgi:hypothetical protein
MPEDTRTGEPTPDQWPDHWTVERLLADPDTARDAGEQDLASLFAALRAPAEPHELARERDHLAAFDSFDAARALEPAPVTSRRRPMLASFLAAKTAAAAVAACAVAGAAGAVTGTLPHGLQQAAHDAVGAPAPGHHQAKPAKKHVDKAKDHATDRARPSTTPTSTPVGPDATGSARHGLCTAFRHGGLPKTSVSFRSLSDAAGGPDRIPAFCADVLKPKPTGKPSDKPTGKPSDKPGERPSDKAKDKVKPTDRPAPHPSATTPAP